MGSRDYEIVSVLGGIPLKAGPLEQDLNVILRYYNLYLL